MGPRPEFEDKRKRLKPGVRAYCIACVGGRFGHPCVIVGQADAIQGLMYRVVFIDGEEILLHWALISLRRPTHGLW